MTNTLKIFVTLTFVIFSISNLNAQPVRDYNFENTETAKQLSLLVGA